MEPILNKAAETIQAISSTVQTISSTANKLGVVYEKTKEVASTGQKYYDQGQAIWEKISLYLAKFEPVYNVIKLGWLKISNNNEPKRVAIIIGVILVVWLLWKLGKSRSREFYDK